MTDLAHGALIITLENNGDEIEAMVDEGSSGIVIKEPNNNQIIYTIPYYEGSLNTLQLERDSSAPAGFSLKNVEAAESLADWNEEDNVLVTMGGLLEYSRKDIVIKLEKSGSDWLVSICKDNSHSGSGGVAFVKCSEWGDIYWLSASIDTVALKNQILTILTEKFTELTFVGSENYVMSALPEQVDYKI